MALLRPQFAGADHIHVVAQAEGEHVARMAIGIAHAVLLGPLRPGDERGELGAAVVRKGAG